MTSICTVQEGARERIFASPCTGAVAPTVKIRWPRYKAQAPNQEYKNKNEQSVITGASAATFILTMRRETIDDTLGNRACLVKNKLTKVLLYFSVSSLCLNISKIKCFETSTSTGSLEKKNAEGKGSEHCISSVIFGWRSWAVCQAIMQEDAEITGAQRAVSVLAQRTPRVMGRSRQWRRCCSLHHVIRRDFRQTQSTRKPKHPHTEMAYVLYCLTGRKQLFAQAVRPTYQKKKIKKKDGNEM